MKLRWLLILFLFSATVLVVNRYTPLYINNDIVHFLMLFTSCYSLVILAGHAINKLKDRKSELITFVAVAIICFGKAFLTWGGEWKTQTILYRNRENSRKTIEYQMRGDRFSFGFKKRVVGRLRIVPSIDWVTDVDTLEVDRELWQKVNEPVKALGLKNYGSHER